MTPLESAPSSGQQTPDFKAALRTLRAIRQEAPLTEPLRSDFLAKALSVGDALRAAESALALLEQERERLLAEADRLFASRDDWADRARTAESENAALRKDRERIDWLEARGVVQVIFANGGALYTPLDGPERTLRITVDGFSAPQQGDNAP